MVFFSQKVLRKMPGNWTFVIVTDRDDLDGQIYGNFTSGGVGVFISSDGKLATSPSSRRFKEEIRPMAQASKVLFALKPVTFRYKKEIDAAGTSQFGLVAEEVAKVAPDLVARDAHRQPFSVRYDEVNAMLLN